MVYLSTSEEWQHHSALLLQARPTTARITTKYKIPNLDSPKYQKPRKRKRDGEADGKDAAAPRVPKAWLVLKTYDPESGVVLKFKTDKAADVGRLINGLGRLGRHMAALPVKEEGPADTVTQAETSTHSTTEVAASSMEITPAVAAEVKPQPGAGGGGGKKKKKGKK